MDHAAAHKALSPPVVEEDELPEDVIIVTTRPSEHPVKTLGPTARQPSRRIAAQKRPKGTATVLKISLPATPVTGPSKMSKKNSADVIDLCDSSDEVEPADPALVKRWGPKTIVDLPANTPTAPPLPFTRKTILKKVSLQERSDQPTKKRHAKKNHAERTTNPGTFVAEHFVPPKLISASEVLGLTDHPLVVSLSFLYFSFFEFFDF